MGCLNFNVEIVSEGLDVRAYDIGKHLEFSCGLVCTVELRWEQFIALDGEFYDANNEAFMVKRI